MLGQCYDGSATMSGKQNGLKTLLLKENPKAHYINCYGHSLQLAAQDATKVSHLMVEALDLSSEIAALIRKSSKRTAMLAEL